MTFIVEICISKGWVTFMNDKKRNPIQLGNNPTVPQKDLEYHSDLT